MGKNHPERGENGVANGLITAVVLVALFGLGIMFGGAIALKQGGGLDGDIVGLFMFLTFLIVGTVDIFLLKQLARVLGTSGKNQRFEQPPPLFQPAAAPPNEFRAAPLRTLSEPIPSVTENTTRTLEHSLRESSR
jgi:hypothetical protein